jgi:hypothetical protein
MKDLPRSWTGRINIVKMVILPKAIYKFNATPIKIPMLFFKDIKKSIMKFTWKHKRLWTATAILSEKQRWRYLNTRVQTTLQSRSNKKSTELAQKDNQWTRTEEWEMKSHSYSHLIFDKPTTHWRTASLFNIRCWENWLPTCETRLLSHTPHQSRFKVDQRP